jgi:hypothetical protein
VGILLLLAVIAWFEYLEAYLSGIPYDPSDPFRIITGTLNTFLWTSLDVFGLFSSSTPSVKKTHMRGGTVDSSSSGWSRWTRTTMAMTVPPPTWQKGTYMIDPNDPTIDLFQHCYMNNTLHFLVQYGFSPTGVADIGANEGTWALMTQQVLPNATLFLIEGSKHFTERLSRTGMDHSFSLCGAYDGNITFYENKYATGKVTDVPVTKVGMRHVLKLIAHTIYMITVYPVTVTLSLVRQLGL